jgi:hypothetical protein
VLELAWFINWVCEQLVVCALLLAGTFAVILGITYLSTFIVSKLFDHH